MFQCRLVKYQDMSVFKLIGALNIDSAVTQE